MGKLAPTRSKPIFLASWRSVYQRRPGGWGGAGLGVGSGADGGFAAGGVSKLWTGVPPVAVGASAARPYR